MSEKNDFKLDVVSIRLVKEAPIYSEQSFDKPEEVAAVMGDCMCQFDREVVCVVNLSSDLKPINVHFASVGSLNEAKMCIRDRYRTILWLRGLFTRHVKRRSAGRYLYHRSGSDRQWFCLPQGLCTGDNCNGSAFLYDRLFQRQ